ncbi:LysR family transcriptional regulator [Umezawaea tangerina]|uniref:DNA-binding transcriptional LysR family regulator n=1 Tax=Umezawaea tangerina TaxID=84725 RepID=A0A2T0SZ85_9PSEU|nr:LysR family transcriptional regulator [Umezawaea tangerina]PRY38728.1 DNA-binding transcriptional LysR family regulator [Umezawaea tangerina]
MLDVHRLRLLRELERRGTLAAVARALSYSPSAISQQLAQLENETGVRLLEHVGRGVRLTEQARILVTHTDAILGHLEVAEAELAASLTEVTGTLRVASFQSVLLALAPAALSLLAERHPGLRVEITQQDAGGAFAGLLSHDFDLVLGEEYPGQPHPPMSGVDTEDLAFDEMRIALPATGPHSRAHASLADLADTPWVLDPPDSPTGRWARTLCHDAGFAPDVRFESSDLLLQVHLVETGHAATLLPDLVWTDRPRTVGLHHLPGRPRRRLFTGVRHGAALHPAPRAFRDGLHHGLRLARAGS